MTVVITPPNKWPLGVKPSVFLSGSIEMGSAPRWQDEVIQRIGNKALFVFNPRRDEWDSSWEQSINNPRFRQQVEWELDAIDDAQVVAVYFAPSTKSPITLMEFGMLVGRGNPRKTVVCCPPGFWRKGNVDVVCVTCGIQTVGSLERLPSAILEKLAQMK